MATILIADDNSNIQRMVTLAFKDEGIDVVSVGNGEAAVRKAPEMMPDLVLADIFMPVRNGYEVCEFIKQDARLAHVPVILLIGAFDPFDEREARRVGADGVLKKPFVPPDPLVSLVKELLAKAAAQRLVPVSVAAAAPQKNSVAAPAVAPEEVAPREIPPAPAAFEVPSDEEPEQDRPFKAFTIREDPAHSGKEGGSSAFGSFLETVTDERDKPADMRWAEPETEESASEDPPVKGYSGFSSWLSKTPIVDSAAPPVEERQTSILPPSADRITPSWKMSHSAEARPEDETIVEPLDRFSATHFPVYRDEPRKPESEEVEANEFGNEPVADATPEISGPIEAPAQPATEFPSLLSTDDTQTIDAIRSSSMPWHSVPSAIRDMQHESPEPTVELSSQDSAIAEPVADETPIGSTDDSRVAPDATDSDAPVYEAVGDEQERFDLTSSVETMPAVIPSSDAESFPVPAPPPMDPRQIEEIVSRVVERMQPQVLEVITREILRPVVEALVRRQLELK